MRRLAAAVATRSARPVRPPRTSRPSLVVATWLLVAVAAGCGTSATSVETFVCTPACPPATHCEAGGCVPDGAGLQPDLPAPADQAMSCAGACSGGTPVCDLRSGQCVACLVDADCPAGNVCRPLGASFACVPGCSDNARCGGGASQCCAGACVDTASDPQHCGGCGTACAADHAIAACVDGACATAGCAPRWADCNHDAADGCETNVEVDPAHCGACDTGCKFAHGRGGCAGRCYLQACDFGYDDCNSDEGDGCEKSLLADVANCGGCGKPCPAAPHAKQGCRNGSCQLDSCDRGFADCDGNAANGCEVNVFVDKGNCGACGAACAPNNVCTNGGCTCPQCMLPGAVSKCVNNQCAFDRCLADFADCDNDVGNGCEVNLQTDSKSCGACNAACPKDQVCVGGKCNSAVCQKGAARLDIAPGGDMVVCDDPNDATCEQDMEALCPVGWQLCTYKQHAARRGNWNYPVDLNQKKVLLGEIACRGGGGGAGAGHFTIPDANNQPNNAGNQVSFNCYYGSSRPTCMSGFGCNEQYASALCCAPTQACGNGQVDAEEDCDDGNQDETDACLNNCAWRVPADHGLGGTNC